MMTEEGVVRVLAVSDGVEMSGEDEGGRFVYKEWPSVESVEPEEGHAGEETVVRVEMAGGHRWRWEGAWSAGWEGGSDWRGG